MDERKRNTRRRREKGLQKLVVESETQEEKLVEKREGTIKQREIESVGRLEQGTPGLTM